ncbi:PaaD-like protein [Cutibacterium acnes JCM 18916]|nr:PaaD-like protein [Cutibacterium acnes JCM 18916]
MSEENALPGQEVTLTAMPTVDDVIEAMKDVIDPELMVNVVDLGLVYGVNIDGEGNVTIDMTLTSLRVR